MNWYVKYEGTEEISGPMTKEEALSKADQADGMIFSEDIFSPEFVTTSEVDHVIASLRVLCKLTQEGRDFNELLEEVRVISKRAINTITLLSVEQQAPVINSEVDGLLHELQGIREALEIIREGENDAVGLVLKQAIDTITLLSVEQAPVVTSKEVEELLGDLHGVKNRVEDHVSGRVVQVVGRAIDMIALLVNLSRPKVVTGSIRGGVLTSEEVPDGVEVDIRDYDVTGEEDNLEVDDAGRAFSLCKWGG